MQLTNSYKYSYLLKQNTISYPPPKPHVLKNLDIDYNTVHPGLALQIQTAHTVLNAQVSAGNDADRSKQMRPLNSLVLGPPGSGKSTLVKALRGKPPVGGDHLWFKEYNLSHCTSIADITAVFKDIQNTHASHENKPGIALIDEFDVRISGVAATQALISPMYDARSNISYVFSGSYLRSRRMLADQLDRVHEFNMRRFLSTLRIYTPPKYKAAVKEADEVLWRLDEKEDFDPDESALRYVASLEKLVDFRSRINGFIIEIPDLDAPLDVTEDRFRISRGPNNEELRLNTLYGPQLIDFTRAIELERDTANLYRSIDQPAIELQHVLLSERLWRLIRLLIDSPTLGGRLSKGSLNVKRSLLNYLAVIPLRHGMRSLEFLVSRLTASSTPLVINNMPKLDRSMLAVHVREIDEFRSDTHVWIEMARNNPDLFDQNEGDANVRIEWN